MTAVDVALADVLDTIDATDAEIRTAARAADPDWWARIDAGVDAWARYTTGADVIDHDAGRTTVNARTSALKALSHAHPDEYRALYADALGGDS